MSINFSQKREIISYLSDPDNWSNRFDLASILDGRRKWSCRNTGRDGAIGRKPDGKAAYLRRHNTQAIVVVEQQENGALQAADESGRYVMIKEGRIIETNLGNDAIGHMDENGGYETSFLDEFDKDTIAARENGFSIKVGSDGRKFLVHEDSGITFGFGRPVLDEQGMDFPEIMPHMVEFFGSNAQREWGIGSDSLLNATKVLLSLDLGIEPSLQMINEVDEKKFMEAMLDYTKIEYDMTWDGPEQWRPKIKKVTPDLPVLAKDFNDSTEFEGILTGVPKTYLVQGTGDGFKIFTHLGERETIWSHGHLIKKVFSDSAVPLTRTDVPARNSGPFYILNMITASGQPIENHRSSPWSAVLVENKNAPVLARDMRASLMSGLGLEPSGFLSTSLDEDRCILAISQDELSKVSRAMMASKELQNMITGESHDVKRMSELLDKGADYRYVDSVAARRGFTFANLMKDSGKKQLLKVYEEKCGLHDIGYEAPPEVASPAAPAP